MPCNDISELLRVAFDDSDRVARYSLEKRTCGAEVGKASLLLPLVCGLTAEEVCDLDASRVHATFAPSPAEEFVYFKHLAALQVGLGVLLGRLPASPDGPCTPLGIVAEAGALQLEALVSVEALTDKIKACGNCGSCGSARKSKRT